MVPQSQTGWWQTSAAKKSEVCLVSVQMSPWKDTARSPFELASQLVTWTLSSQKPFWYARAKGKSNGFKVVDTITNKPSREKQQVQPYMHTQHPPHTQRPGIERLSVNYSSRLETWVSRDSESRTVMRVLFVPGIGGSDHCGGTPRLPHQEVKSATWRRRRPSRCIWSPELGTTHDPWHLHGRSQVLIQLMLLINLFGICDVWIRHFKALI